MVPSLSISSTLSFPECHPVADYVFFLVFLSLLSFLHYRVLEGSSYSRCKQSSCRFFILFYVGYFFLRWLYAVSIFHTVGPTDLLHPSAAPRNKNIEKILVNRSEKKPLVLRFVTLVKRLCLSILSSSTLNQSQIQVL
jgi:hypothetical protein